MMSVEQSAINGPKITIKQLKSKANDFLTSRRNANNLIDIINYLEEFLEQKLPLSSCLLAIEIIFTEVLKRNEMVVEITPLKMKDDSPETKYREWLRERYEESLKMILGCINSDKTNDSTQALVTYMKLLSYEGKHPITTSSNVSQRLRDILFKLLTVSKSNIQLVERFKEYAEYLDVVYNSWRLLPSLTPKGGCDFNETFAHNYLELITVLPVTKDLQDNGKRFFTREEDEAENALNYVSVRKAINKVWSCVMLWKMEESIHKKVLIVLLERILPHLDQPILLTDFLMDSLDMGGPISLLALQGVFTLIQKHNITYPDIYEKLYSMFEPEIFHTKFKARLFYLADIFLSSTHLPETLVAAFVKRLARLSLIAPPQDAIIIMYFIGNLILRHPGLKRLICADSNVNTEVSRDPYVMDEREPLKSNALESSLWEIVTLQKHAVPSVAIAAKFISQPLPSHEWDLSSVLEVKEDDIFDQEISRKLKQYALAFERPLSMYLQKSDKVKQHWRLT